MSARLNKSEATQTFHPPTQKNGRAGGARKDESMTPSSHAAANSLDVPGSRLKTALSWCTSKNLCLENTSSVARDHLANERTFLAWMRTSITLASIGIVIAQLFRLSTSRYTLPYSPESLTSNLSNTPSPIPVEDVPQVLANLVAISARQDQILATLQNAQSDEKRRYNRLGKPIGAAFLMVSLFLVIIAVHRYLTVQHFLVNKNYFPPARRSIALTALVMLGLTCTTFSLILVLQ